MKKSILFLALLLFVKASSAADLKVIIPNIKKVVGNIYIGIFNNKQDHLKDGKQLHTVKIKVTDKKATYTFKGLNSGSYSVAIFHDQNEDGVCNTNALGIPTERYGFSNNVKPLIKAPSFDQTKINIKDRDTSISIHLLN